MTSTHYTQQLAPVIAASWFTIDNGTYIYARVQEVHDAEKHLQVIRDGNEITVVTDISNLPLQGDFEANKERWKLINIRCGNPFYCVGFIAYIAGTLSAAGIDMVITSSFSNDLLMVIESDLERAVNVMTEAGFEKR